MSAPRQQPVAGSGFGAWMGSMWLYTVLRFALFAVLWGIFYLVGLNGLLSALIALVVSVPLSFVLLARPRARFANQIEQRMAARRTENVDLASQLDPNAADEDFTPDDAAATQQARDALRRRKQR